MVFYKNQVNDVTLELREAKQTRYFPNENGPPRLQVKEDRKINETFVTLVSEEYAATVDELQKVREFITNHAQIDNLEKFAEF